MPHFLTTWIITTVALLITANVIPGFHLQNLVSAIIAAVVIGLANATVRPVLFFFTLPITILTLGLFSFVINALTIWVASAISPGFRIDGFIPALIGSLLVSVISGVLHFIFNPEN